MNPVHCRFLIRDLKRATQTPTAFFIDGLEFSHVNLYGRTVESLFDNCIVLETADIPLGATVNVLGAFADGRVRVSEWSIAEPQQQEMYLWQLSKCYEMYFGSNATFALSSIAKDWKLPIVQGIKVHVVETSNASDAKNAMDMDQLQEEIQLEPLEQVLQKHPDGLDLVQLQSKCGQACRELQDLQEAGIVYMQGNKYYIL